MTVGFNLHKCVFKPSIKSDTQLIYTNCVPRSLSLSLLSSFLSFSDFCHLVIASIYRAHKLFIYFQFSILRLDINSLRITQAEIMLVDKENSVDVSVSVSVSLYLCVRRKRIHAKFKLSKIVTIFMILNRKHFCIKRKLLLATMASSSPYNLNTPPKMIERKSQCFNGYLANFAQTSDRFSSF